MHRLAREWCERCRHSDGSGIAQFWARRSLCLKMNRTRGRRSGHLLAWKGHVEFGKSRWRRCRGLCRREAKEEVSISYRTERVVKGSGLNEGRRQTLICSFSAWALICLTGTAHSVTTGGAPARMGMSSMYRLELMESTINFV